MSKKLSLAPFAHLLGMARAEDKDEKEKSRRAEKDEDEKEKGRRASEDEKEKEGAEERDEDERAEEEEEEEEGEERRGKKSKKAKKARRAEEEGDEDDDTDAEEEDDDEEMRGNSAAARARRRERARCKAIFASAAAGSRPDVAASLAFDTNMTRQEAIKVLNAAATGAQPRRSRLDERMNSVRVAQAGADAGEGGDSNLSPVARAIIAAGEKARGK